MNNKNKHTSSLKKYQMKKIIVMAILLLSAAGCRVRYGTPQGLRIVLGTASTVTGRTLILGTDFYEIRDRVVDGVRKIDTLKYVMMPTYIRYKDTNGNIIGVKGHTKIRQAMDGDEWHLEFWINGLPYIVSNRVDRSYLKEEGNKITYSPGVEDFPQVTFLFKEKRKKFIGR